MILRRWETYLALIPIVLASFSLYVRGRSVFAKKNTRGTLDAYERALRIQEARERKLRR
jgi:uncharacterized protein YmfQ (DUF2313 family)